MIVRKTEPQEARCINELFAIAFETPVSDCPASPDETGQQHWAAYTDNGKMMSCITIPDFTIRFDGNACKMGGIGGVSTLPQYRRMGGIRKCFEAALPAMYAEGYEFSYLYPFSTAYYRKFGYECCVQKFDWAVNLSLLSPPAWDGSFCLAEKDYPMTESIRAVDRVWENSFNMMVLHNDRDYSWTEKIDPPAKQEFTYVCFDCHGSANAYTTFKLAQEPDGRNLVCSRFCFTDRSGFAGLMHLFKSLSADHAFVKFKTPALPSLQYLMPEWSLGAVHFSLSNGGMVRVVNVESTLKKAAYRGSGTIHLAIHDPQIAENCGTFSVTFAEGRAVSVEKCGAEPDAKMTIPTFSALLAGVCDFDAAAETFAGLEICNPSAPFSSVFFRKPLMITDFF